MSTAASVNGESGSVAPHVELHEGRRDRTATHRLCALTRIERPTADLLRFVAGPGDRLYFDAALKLPGRGVWITADCQSVLAATKAGAFQRSLKRKVEVPADLDRQVERQLAKRTIQSLSIANKAGLVVTGFDKVSAFIERSDALVLVHGADAAQGGRGKLDWKLQAVLKDTPKTVLTADCLTIDELSLALGRPNVVHAALKEGGAGERFAFEAMRLARYRTGLEPNADCSAGRRNIGRPSAVDPPAAEKQADAGKPRAQDTS
ncbi:MAG: RNA-binding protein [Alphaproteobacteria bacterium]|nr:RNA-binding protein [Alphaproteobacteria bacterium]